MIENKERTDSKRKDKDKKPQWIFILLALSVFILVSVIGLMNLVKSDPAEKAENIAKKDGYSLYKNESIREDNVAQDMLDKIDPDLYKNNDESSTERYKKFIYDMGEKDGKEYLLEINLKDEKVTVIKPMTEEDQKDYYQLLDAVESFQ